MEIKTTSEYRKLSPEETIRLLDSTENGLAESEAMNRIGVFGYNEVAEKKKSPLLEFLSRYWAPMPWLLELAMLLSFVLGHYLEAAIIFILLTINAIIGYLHASRSRRALELLKKKLAIKAKVLRDGKWCTKDAKELVPGDIVFVELGDIVPADAKILSGEVSVDQSALTGESLPVDLHRSDIIYSSSIVRRGKAKCIVVNTGANTYFGRTAELVETARPKSHQEEIIFAIVKYLMCLGVVALILVSSYAVFMNLNILLIPIFAVTFLMGAIPIALPAVLTVLQAAGAMELARRNVLVTGLGSIEDAASIDVLCLDKTGTITQNRISVVDCIAFSGYKKEDVAAMASLASVEENGDPIDLAVIGYGKTVGVNLNTYKRHSFTPFDPITKRSEAIVEAEGKRFWVVKGAPQIVISMTEKIDKEVRENAEKMVEELSRKGYRVLAVARSEDGGLENLRLMGLLSLADPVRPDSKEMIEEARKLGIKPMMLTGDNIAIAKEIAREVSIGDRIIRMADIKDLSEAEQAKVAEECDGFAEVYPEEKYKIVKLLQSGGHMVGMTGDGVNDAPALKQAEMGIAVNNSTDVAKASASVVLTEPGTKAIVDAIKTSRRIYQRMLTWVINKVTKTIQFIGLLTLGFFWFHDVVITLLGMSLLVFANDFATMSLATDNVEYTENPNKWNVKNITLASLVIGVLLVAEGVFVILIAISYFRLGWNELRTLVTLTLIFTSQFRVIIVRERRYFWSSLPSKGLLISSVAAVMGFALLGVYGIIIQPIPLYQVLFALGFSMLFTFGIDPLKYYVFKKLGL
ncbi:MAG: plasma-membrane proton-efflux P-type ATPase [Candidatus Hadarchaeum sp.]|uniref:plasma-membrane proton-efflux P-type ATPase n=1 Tax=Candidatus Hadarchaeum sp. TaxID=2883567 RepID=UPI003D111E03